MNQLRRILFVVPSLTRAGAEMQVVSLVNGLDPNLFEKTLVWFEKQHDLLDLLDPKLTAIPLRRLQKLDWTLAKRLAKLIDQNEIDVVHCTLLISLFYAWLALFFSRRRPRLVVAIHTTTNRNLRNEVFDWLLYRWIIKACTRVLFVCDAQLEHWTSRFPFLTRTARRIYNGVDPAHFAPAISELARAAQRSALGVPEDVVVCLCVAAMRPEKGHFILLDAMAVAHEKNPRLQLYLAGDGALRPALEQRTQELGLRHCVHFLGAIADIRRYLQVADFTVLPSTAVETFSMAVLESLATAVPVLATDIGGAREAVIDWKTGRLVKPGNVELLASALVDMSQNRANLIEYGRRGRVLVQERFTRRSMIDETQKLLWEL